MTAVVPPSNRMSMALAAVLVAGVAAALHLGKLPPAVPALQATLGLGLVEAGFLLSLVQVAGMTCGIFFGLAADAMGLRRSMLIGLALITSASVLGGAVGLTAMAQEVRVLPWLLALRAAEGLGFLMVVMPGPGLIRRLAAPGFEKSAVGLWGAYMPFGIALALLTGPAWIAHAGWPGWWWALAVVSTLAAAAVALCVPRDPVAVATPRTLPGNGKSRLLATLRSGGAWTVALAFAVYSSQWMAVIGFLPTIYASAGVAATWNAVLTAFAAALNIAGNVAGGRLLQRGLAPERLLRRGFIAMGLCSVAAFAQWGQGADAIGLPPALRYLAVCLFSLCGGFVPATLFTLAVRLAPSPSTVSTTVGMVQQASSIGQFVAPPLVAWIAHRAGGWQWTWSVMLVCSIAGVALGNRIAPALARRGAA